MAEGGAANPAAAPVPLCSVCRGLQESIEGMKSLRCGHAVCRNCSQSRSSLACAQCQGSLASGSISRPQSFAEVNLEMTLTQHRECEEKASVGRCCTFRGLVKVCHHCNLYLCPEHEKAHGDMIIAGALGDVEKLKELRQQAGQQMASEEAAASEERYRQFKEGVEARLAEATQALSILDETCRRPIDAYDSHIRRHTNQRETLLSQIDKMLGKFQTALENGNNEEVLNAQRTFQYMQSTGIYSIMQEECAPRLNIALLDPAQLEAQIQAIESALQGLREIQQFASPAVRREESTVSSDELSNRRSCLYMTLNESVRTIEGAKAVVTFEKPLDIDCYCEPGGPLVLFVAEANDDESRVKLRAYTEPQMSCREVPVAFRRNHQLITTFQPRRLAVMSAKKLIAMTDVRSNQYSRHIFVSDFTGLGSQKMIRIDIAQRLNGIYATDNQIYVCDTADCSVFVVDYGAQVRQHRRVACSQGAIPCSVSTWNEWMLVVCGFSITLFSLDSLQAVRGIQAEQLHAQTNGDVGPGAPAVQQQCEPYRDIVHLSNGKFIANTGSTVNLYLADMAQSMCISSADLTRTGVRLEELMGMCAAEKDGKVRIFLCDRRQKQISIISFDAI